MPEAGYRSIISSRDSIVEGFAAYWSRTIDGVRPRQLFAGTSTTSTRLTGASIRCIGGTAPSTTSRTLNQMILPKLIQSTIASTLAAVGNRLDAAFSSTPQTANYQLDGQMVQLDDQSRLSTSLQDTLQSKLPIYANALKDGTMDWKQMMNNSSFVLPLNAADDDGSGSGSGLTVWGSGDYRRLDGDGDVDWDGKLFSVQLGVDKRVRNNLLVGGLVSRSIGDIDYTQTGKKDDGGFNS